MASEQQLIETAYRAFNSRDIDQMETMLHPDVDWPNGWEGGYVHGHAEVRDYWTRQWAAINPSVEPQHVTVDQNGQIVVDVHQVVRDLAGNVLADQMIQHVYTLEDGLIRRMDIHNVTQ